MPDWAIRRRSRSLARLKAEKHRQTPLAKAQLGQDGVLRIAPDASLERPGDGAARALQGYVYALLPSERIAEGAGELDAGKVQHRLAHMPTTWGRPRRLSRRARPLFKASEDAFAGLAGGEHQALDRRADEGGSDRIASPVCRRSQHGRRKRSRSGLG